MTEDSAINNHYQASKKANNTTIIRSQDVTQPQIKKNLINIDFIG